MWKRHSATQTGRLYRFDQIPAEFQEIGIISGYRDPKSSAKECFKSLFSANNETLNFWTHFLAGCYFLWRMVLLNKEHHFATDSYTWPLLSYTIISSIVCFISAFAHAFNTMSVNARHICFFFDYAGISLYSFGSAVVYKAYVFPQDLNGTMFGDYYLHVALVNAVMCTFVTGRTRFWGRCLGVKVLRLGSFALSYFFANVPLVYRIFHCRDEEDCDSETIGVHTRQIFFTFLTGLTYASHSPERLFPGCFDIIGHSHQMFHVAGSLAVRDVLDASIADMRDRKEMLLATHDPSMYSWSLALIFTLILINVTTICIHVRSLFQMPPAVMKERDEKSCCF